jgi:hypothetical protein
MLITIVDVLRSYFQKSSLSLTLPISDAWFWDGHVKQVLENGGFPYVERHHKEVYIAAHTFVELRDFLSVFLIPLCGLE